MTWVDIIHLLLVSSGCVAAVTKSSLTTSMCSYIFWSSELMGCMSFWVDSCVGLFIVIINLLK